MSPSNAPVWRRGIVKQLDPAKARVKVLLPDEDQILTDWLPVLMPFALGAKAYWLPRQGSQVVVLLDEHGEDGVVMGALYSQADPAPVQSETLVYLEMEDGTKITLDPDAQTVTVDTPRHLIAKAGQDALVEAPTITLKGSVTVDGTLTVTQAATLQDALTVAKDATIQSKSFVGHQHQAQGATAITTAPV